LLAGAGFRLPHSNEGTVVDRQRFSRVRLPQNISEFQPDHTHFVTAERIIGIAAREFFRS
jgi:hypothetical protein